MKYSLSPREIPRAEPEGFSFGHTLTVLVQFPLYKGDSTVLILDCSCKVDLEGFYVSEL